MAKKRLGIILGLLAGSAAAAPPPAPFPVFLRQGFSSVLEFPEAPSRVVLGDSESFQVERLDRSLVVKTLTNYATSNLFVYFQEAEPRLFILTASEDAEPTYFKRFDPPFKPVPQEPRGATTKRSAVPSKRELKVTDTLFDDKKDYFTVEVAISADSRAPIHPNWELVRLTFNGKALKSYRLWAERKEIQKDSTVHARFIFVKPNIPRDMKGVTLVVPVIGEAKAFSLSLGGKTR